MATIAMQDTARLGPYLSVSTDRGRSWSTPWKLDLSVAWSHGHGWPTRQNVVNPDGSLVLLCNNYWSDPRNNWRCMAFHFDSYLKVFVYRLSRLMNSGVGEKVRDKFREFGYLRLDECI
ncbi:MAG: hypothetical protein EXQ58_03915 [Acidobacteria bacterium]|nr:hypothetical protein [Acidobacteriota bacterium]